MELEQVFYTIAALFGLASIVYFAWEYLDILPRITKTILLFLLAATLFLAASSLRSAEARGVITGAVKRKRRGAR